MYTFNGEHASYALQQSTRSTIIAMTNENILETIPRATGRFHLTDPRDGIFATLPIVYYLICFLNSRRLSLPIDRMIETARHHNEVAKATLM